MNCWRVDIKDTTLDEWLALLEQRHPRDIDLGLERCGAVYQQLGSPQPARRVVIVAGTNGKGSTVAYLAAISSTLGQRTGSYTSPHIFCFNERISVLGEPVSDKCLVLAFEQVEKARGDISLTYFEFTTLAAFVILQQATLDFAVLEVGLGGRLDAVNLATADCVIITPVGIDHQDFLGPDLSSIATEKAGVIRNGIPLVCTQQDPPKPILQVAAGLKAPTYRRGVDYNLLEQTVRQSEYAADREGLQMCFSFGKQTLVVPRPPMGGEHQVDNLAAALTAFFLLNPGDGIKTEQISLAIRTCKVPGRLQTVGKAPEIILDVGHNELAARAVAAYLGESGRTRVTCVLAMLANKPAESVALVLGGVCQRWFCADSPGLRGQSGAALSRRLKATLPDADIHSFESLMSAMTEAVAGANDADTILVFGSFSTVTAAAAWLQKKQAARQA